RLADWKLVALAATLIFVNQVCFVVSVHETNASTVALMLGATPVIIGVITSLLGMETLAASFWLGAALAFAGVWLVARAGGGGPRRVGGDLRAIGGASPCPGSSVATGGRTGRCSPCRFSGLVLGLGWPPRALVSLPPLREQEWSGLGWAVWLAIAYAILGPLF